MFSAPTLPSSPPVAHKYLSPRAEAGKGAQPRARSERNAVALPRPEPVADAAWEGRRLPVPGRQAVLREWGRGAGWLEHPALRPHLQPGLSLELTAGPA